MEEIQTNMGRTCEIVLYVMTYKSDWGFGPVKTCRDILLNEPKPNKDQSEHVLSTSLMPIICILNAPSLSVLPICGSFWVSYKTYRWPTHSVSQPTCSCLLSLGTPLTNHRHNTIFSVQPATAPQFLLFLSSQTSSVKRHKARVSGLHCQNKLLIGIAPLFILAHHGHVLSIKTNVTLVCFNKVFYSVWHKDSCCCFFFSLYKL